MLKREDILTLDVKPITFYIKEIYQIKFIKSIRNCIFPLEIPVKIQFWVFRKTF